MYTLASCTRRTHRCVAETVASFLVRYTRCLPPHLLSNLQVVVIDKMDYCASLNNLSSVRDKPNFKVRILSVLIDYVLIDAAVMTRAIAGQH